MSEMLVEVAGDAADTFRAQFNIQNIEQARNAVSNLDALWSTPNPWSQRGHPEDRETFDWAGKEVEKRFESGRYKPESESQPASCFSPGNKIAARKDGTFRAISKTPDVCRTPLGCSTPPVPYQVTADLSGSMGVVKNVRFNGKPAYVLNQSIVPTCTGDEPGSAKGVKSGTVGGEVKPIRGSSTVTIGRNPIIRDGDPCTMNNGNCTGVYVTAPTASGSIDSTGNVVGDTNPPLEREMLYQIAGFAKGAGDALWDMGEGFANLAVGAAKLSPISEAAEEASKVTGLYNYRGFSETQDAVSETIQTVLDNPKAIIDGLTKPYIEAWNRGNYGEALGRGAIDVGGLFVGGIGTVGKTGEAAKAAGKVGEAANSASTARTVLEGAEQSAQAAKIANETSSTSRITGQAAKSADAGPAGDGIRVQRKSARILISEDVNAKAIAEGRDPPYKKRTLVIEREADVGEKYNMVIDERQRARIKKGDIYLGGWATPDEIPDQTFARNNLAILERYKPKLPYVARLEVAKPGMMIREGIVGPQGNLPGNAKQIEILGPPSNRADFFRVLGIEPLPPGN